MSTGLVCRPAEHRLQSVIGDAVGVQGEVDGDLHGFASLDWRCAHDVDVAENSELDVETGFFERVAIGNLG